MSIEKDFGIKLPKDQKDKLMSLAFSKREKKKYEKGQLLKKFSHCCPHEEMKNGYENMAEINLGFAEMGLSSDVYALSTYEKVLNGEDEEYDY